MITRIALISWLTNTDLPIALVQKNSQSKSAYPVKTESPASATSVATSTSTSSVQQSPTIEPYLASASADGMHIVLAHKTKFVVVKRHLQDDEYHAIGQGSGCEHSRCDGYLVLTVICTCVLNHSSSSEEITAVFCLPLFVPSIRKSQIFVMVGYNSGWLKVFSEVRASYQRNETSWFSIGYNKLKFLEWCAAHGTNIRTISNN